MSRKLSICFTSDVHGYFFPTNYIDQGEQNIGLMTLAAAFPSDGNTLILDGGDVIQGSPMANLWSRMSETERKEAMPDDSAGSNPFAAMMNLAGYQYVTLGNHDFNFGIKGLADYLGNLKAKCLCCNIRDRAHALPILPWAVHTLENGLRVGIVGACTDFVRCWEAPETVAQLEIEDPVEACRKALAEVRPLCDITVLIYHGGLERDLGTDRLLSESFENRGCCLCRELDFDIVLSGHQHMSVPPVRYRNSVVCQPKYRALEACRLEVKELPGGGWNITGENSGERSSAPEEMKRILQPLEDRTQRWLDQPAGHLDQPLNVGNHIDMAVNGCPLCNFINAVIAEKSGAMICATALANESRGLPCDVTVRDVVSAYIYSNTLVVLDMTVRDFRKYMERCGAYFALNDDGTVGVSDDFLLPKVQHFNYDYFSGVDYTFDIRREPGKRITSLSIGGHTPGEDEHVSVCITSYRFNGTGGFDILPSQRVLKDIQVDVADAIIDYLLRHPQVHVDRHRWCTVVK